MRKGKVLAIVTGTAAAVAGFLHLRKRKNGESESASGSSFDELSALADDAGKQARAKPA